MPLFILILIEAISAATSPPALFTFPARPITGGPITVVAHGQGPKIALVRSMGVVSAKPFEVRLLDMVSYREGKFNVELPGLYEVSIGKEHLSVTVTAKDDGGTGIEYALFAVGSRKINRVQAPAS